MVQLVWQSIKVRFFQVLCSEKSGRGGFDMSMTNPQNLEDFVIYSLVAKPITVKVDSYVDIYFTNTILVLLVRHVATAR